MAKLACVSGLMFILYFVLVAQSQAQCTYQISVKTGDVKDAGTDATVTLDLFDNRGNVVHIASLTDWGVSGPGRDYFERGNLDNFRVSGRCLSSTICKIILSHNNRGNKPGWYVDHVQVSLLGGGSAHFDINRWLATSSAPWTTSVTKDQCSGSRVHEQVDMEPVIELLTTV